MLPEAIGLGRPRRAFALLAVLWVVVGVSSLVLGAGLISRQAVAAAANRSATTRAFWLAEGCLARARAAMAEALSAGRGGDGGPSEWARLDSVVGASPLVVEAGCAVKLAAAGTTLDVNGADREMLRVTLASIEPSGADSLVDALLDWRDSDDLPRQFGAESEWYAVRGRHRPRNGPLADARELARVRGFERLADTLGLVLGVESGRILLTRAPQPVLAALPGMSQEALVRIGELRMRGRPPSLEELAGTLSKPGRDSLMAHYQELARLTAASPDAWLLESSASEGANSHAVRIRVRVIRSGRRAAIVRRQVTR